MKLSIEKHIKIKWLIKDVDGYGFGNDNLLYNLKTDRQIKQSYNNRCIGYWFGKTFISLTKLKPMLFKPEREILPF